MAITYKPKRPDVDLSKKDKSLTSYVGAILNKINRMSIDDIVKYLNEARSKGVQVSQKKIDECIDKINAMGENKRQVMEYMKDLYLKGSGLSMTRGAAVEKIASEIFANVKEIEKDLKRDGEPLDKALWNKAIAEAKKKFDVWPSAYASGWAVKRYKELGGKYASKKR